MLVSAALLCAAVLSPSLGSRYNTVGHRNERQFVQLKSQFDLSPGAALVLPVEVRPQSVGLFGRLPPRLTGITSVNPDNIYGAGDTILVTLAFASDVLVIGAPSLTLNTGCHSDECKAVEVQSFVCSADEGVFALRLEDQVLMNIDVNTTQAQLKNLLESLDGVHNVSVAYTATSPSNVYASVHRVCTSEGNRVTIAFTNVSFPQYDGNVPALQFDVNNRFVDERTGLEMGNGDHLRGVHGSYEASITSQVLREGAEQRDGIAEYSAGSGSNVLDFLLTVRRGDSTGKGTLAVKSIDFRRGSIVSPVTLRQVSTDIPDFLSGQRFMSNISSILGYNRDIIISFAQPQVRLVTSPVPDGVYSVGDVVPIHLVFDFPVKLFDGHLLRVVLSTGLADNPLLFNREARFSQALNSTTLEFLYEVQPRDVSPRLDVLDANSLLLNGGSIYLDNRSNDTTAVLLLPVPGTAGSLSVTKKIEIDTLPPLITRIEVASPSGLYTGGDVVLIDVSYTNRIVVQGRPVLWLSNRVNRLNASVVDAPALPTYAYRRALPGMAAQLALSFQFNFDMNSTDAIHVHLPAFSVAAGAAVPAAGLSVTGPFNDSFVAHWIQANESLQLISRALIAKGTTMTIMLDGSSGLRIPAAGVSSGRNSPSYAVSSSSLLLQSTEYSFVPASAFSVGLADASAIFTPTLDSGVDIEFLFVFPEPIAQGDRIVVHMPGFTCALNTFLPSDFASNSTLSLSWNNTFELLTITAGASSANDSLSVVLQSKFAAPSTGASPASVLYSIDSSANGIISNARFLSFRPICGFTSASVTYTNRVPGAASGLRVAWALPFFGLAQGDSLVFSVSSSVGSFSPVAVLSSPANSFDITYSAGYLTFTALTDVSHLERFVFEFAASGFAVPASGVRATDTFSASVVSSACAMSAPLRFPFEALIATVSDATVSVYPLAVSLGEAVYLEVSFAFNQSLSTGDALTLHLPTLFRNPYISHTVNLTSTLNTSCTYDLYHKSVVLVLQSDYLLPAPNSVIFINLPYEAGFSVSGLGLANDSAALSIDSVGGSLSNWPVELATPCLGFCSSRIGYSSEALVGEPIDISAEFTFSSSLLNQSTLLLDLSAFDFTNAQLSLSLDGSMIVTFPSLSSFASRAVNITLPWAVNAHQLVGVVVNDVAISSTLVSVGPTISIQANNVTFSRALNLPSRIFAVPAVANASLFFATHSGGAQSIVVFALDAMSGFIEGSVIRLNLPHFSAADDITCLNSSASVGNVAQTSSGVSFDLELLSYVRPSTVFSVAVDGLALPLRGLSPTDLNPGNVPSFALSLAPGVFAPLVPILDFPPLVVLVNSSVSIAVSSSFAVASLQLRFSFNSVLLAGDIIHLTLPGMTTNLTTFSVSESLSRFTGIWNATSFSLRLTALVSFVVSDYVLDIYPTLGSDRFLLPLAGYSGMEVATLSVQQVLLGRITVTEFAMPCVGVCSATAEVALPKAGFPSDYFLTFALGGALFKPLDTVSLSLEGFSRNVSSVVATNRVTLLAVWDSATSVLTVQALPTFTSVSSFSFRVTADQSIALPVQGIPVINLFNVSWVSSAVTLVASSPVLVFSSVGQVAQSTFVVGNRVPGQASSYDISFTLRDDIFPGDLVLIGLPNATVPAGPLENSLTNFNITVVGIPSDDTSVLDFFHTSTILLRINQLIAGQTPITAFVPASARVKLPYYGLFDPSPPDIAVVAKTSSITTLRFSSFSPVGSMSPASLVIEEDTFRFVFTVRCSPESNAKLRVYLPNVDATDQQVTTSNSLGITAISSGLWVSSSHTLEFQFLQKIPVNTVLRITVVARLLALNSDIYYADDSRFKYSVTGSLCTMDRTPFESASPILIAASYVRLSVPVTYLKTDVLFGFSATFAFQVGDILSIGLLYLGTDWPSSSAAFTINGSFNSSLSASPLHIANDGSVSLNLTVTSRIAAYSSLDFVLTSEAFVIPSTGVPAGSLFPLTVYRLTETLGYEVHASGHFRDVQAVSSFVTKSVTLTAPVAGAATGLVLRWQLSTRTSDSDVVLFSLPGFMFSGASINHVPCSDANIDSRFLTCSWSPVSSTFSVKLLNFFPPSRQFVIAVPSDAGFHAPATGISTGSGVYQIASISSVSPVYYGDLDLITVVPVVSGTMNLYSCEADADYELSGDRSNIFLKPGHGINDADDGMLVLIDGQIYTVEYTTNGTARPSAGENMLPIREPYSGTIVSQGEPSMALYTSPVRPALYLSGNGTNVVRFAYRIRKGDSGRGVLIEIPTSSAYISVNPDTNGGHMYRYSQRPSLEASAIITNPPYPSPGVIIDTSRPVVLALDSSSPPGFYASGDRVDFAVVFDLPVSIKEGSGGEPALLLHINPYSYVVAYYAAGSGTNALTFVYTVEPQHFAVALNSSQIISTAFPIQQPLRSIRNNRFGYIRRSSDSPLIDAILDFPSEMQLLSKNISVIGIAPKVIRMFSNIVSERGDALTAGDLIYVSVQFSAPVNLSVGAHTPYVLLDVGRSDPGRAMFLSKVNDDMLMFAYEIQSADRANGSLYLYCTCRDFFNRTFLELVDGSLFSSVDASLGASLVLAQDSSSLARRITSPFVIDNDPPGVLTFSTNVTDGIYSPGASILVMIQFSKAVSVYGYVRLLLKGVDTSCAARYFEGNNSNAIAFLYQVTSLSATCRLDYAHDTALDVSKGKLLRLSRAPSIPVDVELAYPGTKFSLGMTTDIIVDSAPTLVSGLRVAESMYMLAQSSFAIRTSSLYDTLAAYRYAQESPAASFNSSLHSSEIAALVQDSFDEDVLVATDGFSSSIIFTASGAPFAFSPLWVESEYDSRAASFQSYWWSRYSVQSSIDIVLRFDRKVAVSATALSLAHATTLNSAFSVASVKSYSLTIEKRQGFDLSQFQLEYGGLLSRCISTHVGPKGTLSLESAMNELAPLRRLGVVATLLADSALVREYQISLLRSPGDALTVATDTGACTYLMDSARRVRLDSGSDVTYRYSIRESPSLVLSTASSLPAGPYRLVVPRSWNVMISPAGIEGHSFRYENFLSVGSPESSSLHSRLSNRAMPRVLSSQLTFESVPSLRTRILLAICFQRPISAGDLFNVTLKGFSGSSFSFASAYSNILWDSPLTALSFEVISPNVAQPYCLTEAIDLSLGLVTPASAVYAGSNDLVFSYNGSLGTLHNSRFLSQPSVAFSRAGIVLSNPTYGAKTAVNVSLDLVVPMHGAQATFSVCLPGFSVTSLDPQLVIEGDFAFTFIVLWDSLSSCLSVSSRFDLIPATYYFYVPLSDSQDVRVGSLGVDPSDPPTVAVHSLDWNLTATPLSDYPSIIGVQSSLLNVSVLRPLLGVSRIQLEVNLTRSVSGPLDFGLQMPDMFSSPSSSELLTWVAGDGAVWSWSNFNQTLSFSANSSWRGRLISLDLMAVSGALLMKDSTERTIADSLVSITAATGFLSPSPLTRVTPVPIVLSSTLSFSSSIFSSNNIVSVAAVFNQPALAGDTISFLLYGVNSSFARNLTVEGVCAQVNSARYDLVGNIFSAKISSSFDCSLGVKSISWKIKSIFGIPYPQTVVQLSSGAFKMQWEGANFSTGFVDVNEAPIVGFISSSVAFSIRSASAISGVALDLLTSVELSAGDEILVLMDGFATSSVASNLEDGRGNLWNLIWSPSLSTLRIVSSRSFPPCALNLSIPVEFGLKLPVNGLSSACNCVSISLKKQGKVLLPQPVQIIQSVGSILALQIKAVAHSKFRQSDLSASVAQHRDVQFTINMTLSQVLNLYDEIHIFAPSYSFDFDCDIPLQGSSAMYFSARAASASKMIVIKVIDSYASNSFLIVLNPSSGIGIPLLFCDQFKSDCPLYVTIASATCPVSNFIAFAECAYAFPQTEISVKNVHYLYEPTGQPTGQPSSSPSSQPSSQPTGKPSGVPSASPVAKISYEPTVTPSSSPSVDPSHAPTSAPTSAPTTNPTSTPSFIPTVSPTLTSATPVTALPTGQPSGQPSAQPSTSPSQRASDYLLRIDFKLLMQTALPSQSSIVVYIPQILSLSDSNATAVLGNQSAHWSSFWNGSAQSLVLTTAFDMAPGLQVLSVVSETLLVSDTIIYENDSSIVYSVVLNDCSLLGGVFDKVHATGLRSSALHFANLTAFGESVGFILDLVAERSFSPGDTVIVRLPLFDRNNSGELVLADYTDARAFWKPSLQEIKVSIKSHASTLRLVISSQNGIRMPSAGCNLNTGIPTLSVDMKYSFRYSATPFQTFSPLGTISNSRLYFSTPAVAGHDVTLYISFDFGLDVVPGDVFDAFLPNFWATMPATIISPVNTTQFSVSWMQCTSTLRIVLLETLSLANFYVAIAGLRLPTDGITPDLSAAYSLSSNATNGIVAVTPFSSVQLIGAFTQTSLLFSPEAVATAVTLTFSFQASFAIARDELLQLHLPGVQSSFSGYTDGFFVVWDAAQSTLNFTANRTASHNELVTVRLNNSVTLPLVGIPGSNYPFEARISSLALDGPVQSAELSHVQCVGLRKAEVHYVLGDIGAPVALRFQLYFCFLPVTGDEFSITAPLVVGLSGIIETSGNLAVESFSSAFNVTYSAAQQSFTFGVIRNLASFQIAVFVSQRSGFYLNRAPSSLDHSMSGVFSKLGTLVSRPLEYFPKTIGQPAVNHSVSLDLSSCNFDESCAVALEVVLASPMLPGQTIAISHPSLVFPSASLPLPEGTAEPLSVTLRDADVFGAISFSSSNISTLPSGSIVTSSDVSYHSVNLTLPRADLEARVVSILPIIISITLETELSDVLICGDSVRIRVRFTDPVSVRRPSRISLALNTNEHARYLSGNKTRDLLFVYHCDQPIQVARLAVEGSDAIRLGVGASIASLANTDASANITVPMPYDLYALSSGLPVSFNVTCGSDALSNVVIVEAYASPTNAILRTGDLLSVRVAFNRKISVVGAPQLLLRGDNNSTLVATYKNVSVVQWLRVSGSGTFTLSYGDETTACIPWDSTEELRLGISSLSSLSLSLPLSLATSVIPSGLVHRIEFHGIAPALLSVSRSVCDYAATAHISVDDAMLYSAVFEYSVREGDVAVHLSYPDVHSLRTDDANVIFLGAPFLERLANVLLPEPGSMNSLAGTTNISIDTSSPVVLSVSSNFTSALMYAVDGDSIRISVKFSAPVTVIGAPYLELNITIAAEAHYHLPRATFTYADTNTVYFDYLVLNGDSAFPLDTVSSESLVLNGSSILLKSLLPSTVANTTLPLPGSAFSLYNSSINVNAFGSSSIYRISSPQPPGVYGAGMTIVLAVEFYGPVAVTRTDCTFNLAAPVDAPVTYIGGSGTATLLFAYLIRFGDNADVISFGASSFSIHLLQGSFVNSIGVEWSSISTPPKFILLDGIVINTSPPFVVRVNATNVDGVYYPGQALDVVVTFSKRVHVIGAPQLEMFVPYNDIPYKLARYSGGNGTYEVHFEYLVPAPDYRYAFHPQIPFDYAGVASLFEHMGAARIIEANGVTPADLLLTIEDQSYLRYSRAIFLNFNVPSVLRVKAANPNGVYTAGDVIQIEVEFSQAVMVFYPPVLRLDVGVENRNGIYVSGNLSSLLLFEYAVLVGDSSQRLDYVDTRRAPFGIAQFESASLALNTDVVVSKKGRINGDRRTPRYNDVFIVSTEYGGIFTSAASALGQRLPANSLLPLPGIQGSLSESSNVVIDTTGPVAKKVYVLAPDGSYGERVTLSVIVKFNFPVVVSGCPYIVFQVHSLDRNAVFRNGSGTTDLMFELPLLKSDQKTTFDYSGTRSLRLGFCDEAHLVEENAEVYIRRASMHPIINANLELPPVLVRETVISPTSIAGGGQNLTLSGGAAYPRVIYSRFGIQNATYSVGDVIDIRVHFSGAVLVPPASAIVLVNISHSAYFEGMLNSTDAAFSLLVLPGDSTDLVTYPDQYALRTKSACDLIELERMVCASQDLPPPYSAFPYALDLVSLLRMRIVPYYSPPLAQGVDPVSVPRPIGISFVFPSGVQGYRTGDLIHVEVRFSDAVSVIGSPYLTLFLGTDGMLLKYSGQPTPFIVTFSFPLTSGSLEGVLRCSRGSRITLNGGRIVRANSFISLQNANTKIEHLCCPSTCSLSASVVSDEPRVTRVFALQSGTYSSPFILELVVAFSRPVSAFGSIRLYLDLPTDGFAEYSAQLSPQSLIFRYSIQPLDYTSQLDYVSSASLVAVGRESGIVLAGSYVAISSGYALPTPGSTGSLGRESRVTIVVDVPRVVNAYATPSLAVIGDIIIFTIAYSDRVVAIRPSGERVQFADIGSSISLNFAIAPAVYSGSVFTPSNGSLVMRSAQILSLADFTITFGYDITASDPTGIVVFSSLSPVAFDGTFLASAKSETRSSTVIPQLFVNRSLSSIDNVVPFVTSVTSSTSAAAQDALGVGDEVNIFVQFSAPVISFGNPVLRLVFGNKAVTNASFAANSSVPGLVVPFKYVIRAGDDANPLEYDGVKALSGDIRRYSSRNSLLPANLDLPRPLSFDSLGDTGNIQIDTLPPYVVAMFPANKPGLYGLNETIFVVVRFSKPVIVAGTPTLTLRVSDDEDGIGVAYYVRTFLSSDVRVEIKSTDLLFRYVVQETDDVSLLRHSGRDALGLPVGADIFQLTPNPTIKADLLLRDYSDMSPRYGKIERQWMVHFPQRVEVLLRDLHHTAPASLSVTLEHSGNFADVFTGVCAGNTFGSSYPKSRLGNNLTAIQPDADIGFDYFFSDSQSINFARYGAARQSTTLDNNTAALAIDGNRWPYILDLSTTSTDRQFQAWWLLRLPANTTVRTVSVWAREPHLWIPPVVTYTVKQLDSFPRGYYRLIFSNINPYHSGTATHSGLIAIGATEEEVAAILKSAPGLGDIAVSRKVIKMCGTAFYFRCSGDSEFGFGYQYAVTLLNIRTAEPNITITDITPLGGAVVGGAANETVNILKFTLVTKVEISTRGHPVAADQNPRFPRGVASPANYSVTPDGYNEWLTPCWVMLFPPGRLQPPDDLEKAKNASIWVKFFNSSVDVQQIVIPQGIKAGFLKIQRESYGALSLAEVEVYSAKLNYLKAYNRGSPVASSTIVSPFQAAQPLDSTFKYTDMRGQWNLRIQQNLPASSADVEGGWSGAYGSLSDVVLVITDITGSVFTFYQQLVAEITSLPKHGALYATSRENTTYWDFQEAFEVDPRNRIDTKEGEGRPLGLCYKDPTCASAHNKGPLLDDRHVLGDSAAINFIRSERVVVYVPDSDYVGPDYFTYVIRDGATLQSHAAAAGAIATLNEVTLNTRVCRRYSHELHFRNASAVYPLCACAFDYTSTTALSIQACGRAVINVCASGEVYRSAFVNMCESCGLSAPSSPLTVSSILSGACSVEIYRAVWFVTDRGMCSSAPRMDCSSETTTEPGDDARNYLSPKPPLLHGSLTALGSSFGGYGWFDSSTMN